MAQSSLWRLRLRCDVVKRQIRDIDLVLAALLISGLPGTALWAVGVIVGIDLAFGGAALIGLALAARNGAATA